MDLRDLIAARQQGAQKGWRTVAEIAEEKEARREEQTKEFEEREQETRTKQQRTYESFVSRKRHITGKEGPEEEPEAAPEEDLPDVGPLETKRRLRALGEPATMFGELAKARLQRLCALGPQEPESDEAKAAEAEVAKTESEAADEAKTGPTPRVAEEAPETAEESAAVKVRRWIDETLGVWEIEVRRKTAGTAATSLKARDLLRSLEATKKDLKPLLRELQRNAGAGLDPGILEKLEMIVDCCHERSYRKAHDKYIELAIGNAAWPMGVTMVGIHERAGRSKIFQGEIAHILNDETTRKYIQTFKRLMSCHQRMYPTEDPSEMVLISTTHC